MITTIVFALLAVAVVVLVLLATFGLMLLFDALADRTMGTAPIVAPPPPPRPSPPDGVIAAVESVRRRDGLVETWHRYECGARWMHEIRQPLQVTC